MQASRTTVLIADDDPGISNLLVLLLEEEGYMVRASYGAQVLALAVSVQPALILLDVNMPGMDGFEVARRLRSDPRTRHIPIVLMSAMRHLAARAPVLVEGVLPKPFELDALLAYVKDLAGPPAAKK